MESKLEVIKDQFLIDLLNEIKIFLGTNNFIFFGGALVDYLLGKDMNFEDLDIGVKYNSKKDINNIKNNLIFNGFKILEEKRNYIIYKNVEVVLMRAKLDNYILDLSFMKSLENVGHFNIDSIFISGNSFEIHDPKKYLTSKNKKKIIPSNGFYIENPFMLLRRLLFLERKYKLSFRNPSFLEILENIFIRIKRNKEENYEVLSSFYSYFFNFIIKYENKKEFILNLIKYNVFHIVLPEIEGVFIDNLSLIEEINSKKDLINLILSNLFGNDRKIFLDKIKLFKIRTWDNEDINIYESFFK